MGEYIPYFIVMMVSVLLGFGIIKLIDLLNAKGHLKKLRPIIENLIQEAELTGENGNIKMNYVLDKLSEILPDKYRVVLQDKRIRAFVEKVFQEVKDHLKKPN